MIRALLVECVEREYGVEVEAIEELKRLYLYKSYKLRMKNGEMYNLKEFHRDADKEVLNTVFSLKSILEQAGIRMGNIRKTQRGARSSMISSRRQILTVQMEAIRKFSWRKIWRTQMPLKPASFLPSRKVFWWVFPPVRPCTQPSRLPDGLRMRARPLSCCFLTAGTGIIPQRCLWSNQN